MFGVCFVSTLEDTWLFAFHLFSNNVRIADQPQDVLMTVRASSVHGMSYKKNHSSLLSALATHLSLSMQSKNARSIQIRKLCSQTNSWRLKPPFPRSISNIHQHLTKQLDSSALRWSLLLQAERLTETVFSSLREATQNF